MIAEQDIARIRSFNRLVTRQVGALSDRYLGRLPLGEARVLFEIGSAGSATPRDGGARLGLDSGYLSRVLGSLKRHGFVEETPDPRDRRTKRVRVTGGGPGRQGQEGAAPGGTAAGRAEQPKMDEASAGLATATLGPLTDEQRERLLRAEDEVRRLLALSMFMVGRDDPASSDARWCLDH